METLINTPDKKTRIPDISWNNHDAVFNRIVYENDDDPFGLFYSGSVRVFTSPTVAGLENASTINLNATNEFTMEAWVKPADFGMFGMSYVRMWSDVGGTSSFYIGADAWGIPEGRFYSQSSAPWVTVTAPTALPLNQWSHLALTYDGTLKLYVNGVLVDSEFIGKSLPTALTGAQFGGDPTLDTLIDDVRFCHKALEPAQLGYYATFTPELVDASSFGFDPVDATDALQKALDLGPARVHVPNMGNDWIVRPLFVRKSNMELQFDNGVVVTAKPGAFPDESDCLFTVAYENNVTFTGYGATLRMQKAEYTTGEWRMGIRMYGGSGNTVRGLTIRDTGGDGIYVGASGATNTTIKDVVCINNKRQGISVISARNLLIDNCTLINTNGTAPAAGIDFEPNSDTDVLDNCTVRKCIFAGNAGGGLLFALNAAQSAAATVAVEKCTMYDNGQNGLHLYYPMPNSSFKDCLLVQNDAYGFFAADGATAISYSAFWNNAGGTVGGTAQLGTGCLTAAAPAFASTDPANAGYLYLAESCPAVIVTGASDGGYMGARPIFGTPEPTPTPTPAPTPTMGPLPGDANRDGRVTFADFSILQNHYGQSVTGDTWALGDFNNDSRVTFEDFSLLQNHYGQTRMDAAPAAEDVAATGLCSPMGLVLAALLGLALLALRNS